MNNIAYYEHARWRFSIVAGHPSLRGHHCTLRVWAPLSFTGGMKGLDGWVSKIIVPPASIRGFIHRDGPGYKRKHKSGNDASVTFILLTTGASVLCFINLSFIKYLLSGYFYFQVFSITSWEPRWTSTMVLLSVFGFLGWARSYLFYPRFCRRFHRPLFVVVFKRIASHDNRNGTTSTWYSVFRLTRSVVFSHFDEIRSR